MPDLTHPLDAARHWQGLHYREHGGDFESCDSRMCQRALNILTAPSEPSLSDAPQVAESGTLVPKRDA